MKYDSSFNNYRNDGKIHEPWLIQRARAGEFKPDMRSSEYLKLSYMGSAEFEFGALPAWQREMASKLDKLAIRLVEHNGQTLYIMAENSQLDEYAEMIRKVIDGKVRTKERVGLNEREIRFTEPRKKGGRSQAIYDDPSMPYEFDVFWDITNGLAFARSIDVLNNMKVTIRNSVRYMNDVAKKAK